MAKDRALRDANSSADGFVGLGELVPTEKALDLMNYALRSECKIDDTAPRWAVLPGEIGEGGCDRDWPW